VSKTFEESLKRLYEAENGEEYKTRLIEAGYHTHTPEQVDELRKAMVEIRFKVFDSDPVFKEEFEERRRRIIENMNASNTKRRTEATVIIDGELSKAKSKVRRIEKQIKDEKLEEWIENKKFKPWKKEEREKSLFCPICRERRDQENNRNQDDKLICVRHGHILVSKDELKKYNRAYRRAWKKPRS